jgi:hypothetical protein
MMRDIFYDRLPVLLGAGKMTGKPTTNTVQPRNQSDVEPTLSSYRHHDSGTLFHISLNSHTC